MCYCNRIIWGSSNNTNPAHDVKTVDVALSRMSAIGAVSLLVPGPKMIYHFGELGWDTSIFSCNNGTVNTPNDAIPGDCKLDTKPQPQWTNNWLANNNRNKIYTDWAKMISLKTTEAVFTGTATMNNSSSLSQTIKITNSALASTQLKNVLVLANFDVTAKAIATGFPYPGTWYNLMDNTTINVTDTSAPITVEAGGFRIYGNKVAFLAIAKYEGASEIYLYPNPASNYFTLNTNTTEVQVFSMAGQLVKSFETTHSKDTPDAIRDLSKGLYIVKAVNENNEVQVMKFIKE
ncbi:T9SS type A sorting domain-containing protein [Flavobacterium sp. ALD4]|uniref:T9SS type A sorting domain-containing protein n=1 Tax=Flavobacterium sp. ALD4 TaxID=2058314 RepID=UPI001E2E7EB6|nr:T9SS type A sorting domain-containing protein [Flavobacterium sp. ALD4]